MDKQEYLFKVLVVGECETGKTSIITQYVHKKFENNYKATKSYAFKVILTGDRAVGKSSIVNQFVHHAYDYNYRATIGVDFALKVINWEKNTLVRLQLWDVAGQERYGNMTRVYYKEAVGAFVVFDITRMSTFDAVQKWKSDIDEKVNFPGGNPIPVVLLANKCDLIEEGFVASHLDRYCEERGFLGWFETSAKDNINIEESANLLIKEILRIQDSNTIHRYPDPDEVKLEVNAAESTKCPC